MAHKHPVYDTDRHFSIDPITRAIKNESSRKVNVIQFDHNSERFTFEIPRMVEGHDMTLCNSVQVHYINTDSQTKRSNSDIYFVDDMQVSPDDEEYIVLSWLISQGATRLVGQLAFLIRFACIAEDGTIEYAWNTAIYSGISIASGMNNGDTIEEDYSDTITMLVNWITALNGLPAPENAAVGQFIEISAVGENGNIIKTVATNRISQLEANVADLMYKPITVSSFTNNIGTVEMGQTINSVILSWAFNKSPVSITIDGQSVDNTLSTMQFQTKITANKTYTLVATDERGTTAQKTTGITFYNGVYYGASAELESPADLTKVLTGSRKRSFTVNAAEGQYIWYALPVRLGQCTFKVGGFEGGFDLVATSDYQNPSGYTESYYLYRSAQPSLGNTTVEVS